MASFRVMTVALPFILGLTYIPSVRRLAPVMGLGLILLFAGFGVLAYVIFTEWPNRTTEPLKIRWNSLPLALCAILYSYEGICLVLPVESSMKEPRKFKKVFWGAMASSAIIFATVATLCTRAFGDVTSGSITAFLLGKFKDDDTIIMFLMLANTFVSLSVLFTYPIQLFPTFELVGPNVQKMIWRYRHGSSFRNGDDGEDNEEDLSGFGPLPTLHEHASFIDEEYEEAISTFESTKEAQNQGDKPAEDTRESLTSLLTENTEETDDERIVGDSYFVRTGLVILTYTIAMIVPNVQVLISLAGAVAGSSTALLIPPLLELALIDHLENKPDAMASPKFTPFKQQPATKKSAFRHVSRCNCKGVYWKQKLRGFFLFWMGFMFMIIGSYASISDIVNIYLGKDG